jgi:hypothetical protein
VECCDIWVWIVMRLGYYMICAFHSFPLWIIACLWFPRVHLQP